MWRWSYYDRTLENRRSVMGVVDTRMHQHFDTLNQRLADDVKPERQLRELGRILNYVQDVTSPAHVVPVFTARWWRFSWGDRFDDFPVDVPRLEAALEGRCDWVAQPTASYQHILSRTASDTMIAVRSQVLGFPTTWEAYWTFDEDDDDFGEYGPAGNNFGQRTEFDCGPDELQQRCLLLEDDPLYRDFAHDRHLTAVQASMRAMLSFKRVTQGAPEHFVAE